LAALGLRLVEWADRFPVRKAEPLPLPSALYEVLHAALEEGPILLVVDDAQWLDVESARALEALLRDVGNQPCTLLVGARAHPPHPVLDDLRSRIGRELRGAVVDVPPLDLTALSALTEWAVPAFDEDARARLARRLLVDTAGLPLLAVEILHAVALGLDLGTIAGAWPDPQRTLDQTLPGDLPDAVRAAIRTGFRRLSANAQRLLCATALAPRPADAALLQRATGLEPVELEQALDEAEWQRWLQVDPRGYDFVARILGDVIEQDMLTAGQRQRLRAALDATS
jgi:predicted ATPase